MILYHHHHPSHHGPSRKVPSIWGPRSRRSTPRTWIGISGHHFHDPASLCTTSCQQVRHESIDSFPCRLGKSFIVICRPLISEQDRHTNKKYQLLTTITQTFGVISILHGLGNHLEIIEEVGELRNYLFFTWITVFFFNLAIPTGKIAVAVFLIEMNAQGSEFFPIPCQFPGNAKDVQGFKYIFEACQVII